MGDKSDDFRRIVVKGCSVYPNTFTEKVSSKTGVEAIDGQFTVLWGKTVLMPFGTDIQPTDLVEFEGVQYLVNGKPSEWQGASTGHRSCVEVQLKAASG